MNLLSSILKAGLGLATGGTAGAVAGGLSSLLGGGEQQASQPAAQLSPRASLAETLRQKAFMQGFQEQFMRDANQTFNVQKALGTGNPGESTPASGRQSQQTGGRIGVPGGEVQRRPFAEGLGGGGGKKNDWMNDAFAATDGLGAGGSATELKWQPSTSPFAASYNQALNRALNGQDTLPESAFSSAVNRGMAGVNAQAAASRTALSDSMARRGFTGGGIMGSGLANIERARLGAASNLYGGLEEQQLAATRAAQQHAMDLYASQTDAERNRLLQYLMQGRDIKAGQPSFGQLLGGLLGTWAQYKYGNPTTGSSSGNPFQDVLDSMGNQTTNIPYQGGRIESYE